MVQRLLSTRSSWLLVLAALTAVSVNGDGWRYLVDVDVYRQGAAALLHDPGTLYHRAYPTADRALPFTYPPFGALLLAPLAALPQVAAEVAMTAISVVCLYWSLRTLHTPHIGAILAAALLLEPVTSTISFGQINILLMALVLHDCLAPHRRLPRGLLTGLAAACKLTPGVFLLYFLARRDFRAAAWFTGAVAAATGLAAAFRPRDSVTYFTGTLWDAHRIGDLGEATKVSLLAVLVRADVDKHWWWLVAALGCGVFVIAWRTPIDAACLLTVAYFGLVASPVSWSHHWVWLVPGVVIMWRVARWWCWWALAAMTIGQFHKWLPWGEWAGWESLLAAHYLFVAAALWLICCRLSCAASPQRGTPAPGTAACSAAGRRPIRSGPADPHR